MVRICRNPFQREKLWMCWDPGMLLGINWVVPGSWIHSRDSFPGLLKNEAAGKAEGAVAPSFPQSWEGIQALGLEHPGHQREPQIPAAFSGKG